MSKDQNLKCGTIDLVSDGMHSAADETEKTGTVCFRKETSKVMMHRIVNSIEICIFSSHFHIPQV